MKFQTARNCCLMLVITGAMMPISMISSEQSEKAMPFAYPKPSDAWNWLAKHMTLGRAMSLTSLVLYSTMTNYKDLMPFISTDALVQAAAKAVDVYQATGLESASDTFLQELLLNSFATLAVGGSTSISDYLPKLVNNTMSYFVAKDLLKQSTEALLENE